MPQPPVITRDTRTGADPDAQDFVLENNTYAWLELEGAGVVLLIHNFEGRRTVEVLETNDPHGNPLADYILPLTREDSVRATF